MNDLITITEKEINGLVQTVNARELHAFLEVKKDFSDWIKNNLEMFTQDVDFIVFPLKGENSDGRPRIEYALTIECAKHIAMMSRTAKGMEARNYFIECEKKWKDQLAQPAIDLSNPAVLRNALLNYTEKVIELEGKIEEMKPDCDAFARIAVSEGSMSLTDAAKALQVQPKAFIACLSVEKWIYKRLGTSWIAYQDKIQQGLLEHKVTVVQRDDGSEKSVHQVRVTPKGIARLSKLLNARKAA